MFMWQNTVLKKKKTESAQGAISKNTKAKKDLFFLSNQLTKSEQRCFFLSQRWIVFFPRWTQSNEDLIR